MYSLSENTLFAFTYYLCNIRGVIHYYLCNIRGVYAIFVCPRQSVIDFTSPVTKELVQETAVAQQSLMKIFESRQPKWKTILAENLQKPLVQEAADSIQCLVHRCLDKGLQSALQNCRVCVAFG